MAKSGKKVIIKKGKATVQVNTPGKPIVSESIDVAVVSAKGNSTPAYVDPTCLVEVGMGYTKNMGDYEFVRVDVKLSMPAYPHEINDVYEHVQTWVDKKLEQVLSELNEG